MVTTTTNNLRTTQFQNRQAAGFVTNGDIGDLTANDLKRLVADLIDLQAQITAIPGAATLIKKSYTVGLSGVAGCDYNFTAPANTTEQSIQLGATTIIPALSNVSQLVATVSVAPVGGSTTVDVGVTSGSEEYIDAEDMTTLATTFSSSATVEASGVATSVYFSVTPSANWSTLSAGKWTINFFFYQ